MPLHNPPELQPGRTTTGSGAALLHGYEVPLHPRQAGGFASPSRRAAWWRVISAAEARRAAHALVDGDKPWQAELRPRQSLWRQRLGMPPGVAGDRPVGSRLPAGDRTSNFLTPAVAAAVEEARAQRGALVSSRVYENLLSSQPLAFNLFAEAAADPSLRTAIGRALWPDLIEHL